MGKGKDGCGDSGGMESLSLGDDLGQEAIQAALDFRWDRITTYTITAEDVPEGWGLVPGFEHYPSSVGGTTARWQILVPYLLENYPDDFQLIGSEGIAVQEDGSAIHHSPGSQYLGVRTVYPFDHPRSGQATDGLLTAYNWSKGDGVQGELKDQLQEAQEKYNVRHFYSLVEVRALRALGNSENRNFQTNMLVDDLPEDWVRQLGDALRHMPPIVWKDQNGFKDISGHSAYDRCRPSGVDGYTHSFQGSDIDKPLEEWGFNDGNRYVTTARLQAAAAWCGFLKGCEPPMVILPNLVDQDEPLRLAKDDEGKLVPAEGRKQTPLNYTREKAQELLDSRGIQVKFQGRGDYVIGQDPPVIGRIDAIRPGSTVSLQLGEKAEWKREYVDRIPSQEDRHRRQSGGFISTKQERLVFVKMRSTPNYVDGVNACVAKILGIEPPGGNTYNKKDWLREQLQEFPKDKFDQLLRMMESEPE